MVCCSTVSEVSHGTCSLIVNRVQLDVRDVVPEAQAPTPTAREQLPRKIRTRRSVELARYGYTDQCIGCQHSRCWIDAGGPQ